MTAIREFRWHGIQVAKQAPWIMQICKTPETSCLNTPCGKRSRDCKGEPEQCPECHFSYCTWHYKAHRVRLQVPRDATKTFVRKLYRALNRRANKDGIVPEEWKGKTTWLE